MKPEREKIGAQRARGLKMRREDKTGGFQRPGNLGDRGESEQVRCRDGGKRVRERIPDGSVQRWAGEGDPGGGKPNQEGNSSGGRGQRQWQGRSQNSGEEGAQEERSTMGSVRLSIFQRLFFLLYDSI